MPYDWKRARKLFELKRTRAPDVAFCMYVRELRDDLKQMCYVKMNGKQKWSMDLLELSQAPCVEPQFAGVVKKSGAIFIHPVCCMFFQSVIQRDVFSFSFSGAACFSPEIQCDVFQ